MAKRKALQRRIQEQDNCLFDLSFFDAEFPLEYIDEIGSRLVGYKDLEFGLFDWLVSKGMIQNWWFGE